MNVDARATLDQVIREAMIIVEHSEAASPPAAALVDVRAVGEQEVNHRLAAPPHGSEQQGAVEGEAGQRVVDTRAQLGMAFEAFSRGCDVVGLHRGDDFFNTVHPAFSTGSRWVPQGSNLQNPTEPCG